MKPTLHTKRTGFTLIELLVAIAILGVIVVLCGKIFEQSNIAWKTGSLKAESNLIGRGIADFIAQDISRSVTVPTPVGSPKTFVAINENGVTKNTDASPREEITYTFGDPPTRQVKGAEATEMAPLGYVKSVVLEPHPSLGYVDVKVQVCLTENDFDRKEYTSRAWLINTNRYNYDN